MKILIILEEWNGFSKVDFSSRWDQSVRRSTNKKKHRNHENNEKKLKKKHQKITLSSRLATGLTQATQCICNQDDLKKDYDVSL